MANIVSIGLLWILLYYYFTIFIVNIIVNIGEYYVNIPSSFISNALSSSSISNFSVIVMTMSQTIISFINSDVFIFLKRF
jgi:hypothetical protein